MISAKYIFPLFIAMIVLQLFVPAKMIWNKERIIEKATSYKFKTAPVDPSDPFRGKYISLRFSDTDFPVRSSHNWEKGENVFVTFSMDEEGYAKIDNILKNRPYSNLEYIETTINYISRNAPHKVTVDYPFNRFYMEESKAPKAETLYRDAQQDSTTIAYALVYIMECEAVLQNVFINVVPIQELVEEEN